MDTILNYLENMFMHLPKTDAVERAKRELANMMEDKYNELLAEGRTDNEAVGIVISEFGNLKELAAELGLNEVYEGQQYGENVPRRVSDAEAKSYLEDSKKSSKWISLGVMLCICSPVVLLILGGLQEEHGLISDAVLGSVGLSVLLIQIAVAVAIFIYNGMQMEKYQFLTKEEFSLSKTIVTYLENYGTTIQKSFTFKLILGVIISIGSVIPLIVVGSIWEDGMALFLGVIFILFAISIAVWLFITGGAEKEAIKVLLQMEEYSVKAKNEKKIIDVIAGIYWPIVTCIYLAWSFITHDWGFTWIVWPISGVLFGGIAAICSVVQKES